MTALAGLLLLAASAFAAEPVRSIELLPGPSFLINGAYASPLGSGDFKTALVHPADPQLAVKVFSDKWTPSIQEKRLEVANIRALEAARAVPKLVEQGALMVGGKPTGYLVQERVMGSNLEQTGPKKLAHVRDLFDRLAAAGIELGDVESDLKLRQNIMVGTTRSGGWGAWVIDADLAATKRSPEALRAFYDRLFARLSR